MAKIKTLLSTASALGTTFKNILRPAVTLKYPGCAAEPAEHGKFSISHNPHACKACGNCADECPSGAISLDDRTFTIDTGACCLCGGCVDACRNHAVTFSNECDKPVYLTRQDMKRSWKRQSRK